MCLSLLPYRLSVVQGNIRIGTLMLQLNTIPFTANKNKHSKIHAVKYHTSKIIIIKTCCMTNLAIKTKIQKSEKTK